MSIYLAQNEGKVGYVGKLRCFLTKNRDREVNYINYEGEHVLHLAIEAESVPTVRCLLQSPVDLNVYQKGLNPLMSAIRKGNPLIFNLVHTATVASSRLFREALHIVAANGYPQVLHALPDQKTLHVAIEFGRAEMVKALTSKDQQIINSVDEQGHTSLMHAAQNGCAGILKMLLSYGADANACTSDRNLTPLIAATKCKQVDCMKLLLKAGANVDYRTSVGSTALHLAVKQHKYWVEGFQILLEGGANVNQLDSDGFPPLAAAIGNVDFVALKFLIGAGAKTNIEKSARSLLAYSIYKSRNLGVVQLLVDAGADVNAMDGKLQQTPLVLACLRAQGFTLGHKMVKTLLENNADANTKTSKEGRAPLHFCAELDLDRIAVLLLCYGADVNATDAKGDTPLIIAVRKSRKRVVNVLLQARGLDMRVPDRYGFTALDWVQRCECIEIATAFVNWKTEQSKIHVW